MPSKHEFRFVVSGIELSDEQKEQIGNAVGRAGALALAEIEFESPHSIANFVPREWLGRWLQVLEPGVAGEVQKVIGIQVEQGGLGR